MSDPYFEQDMQHLSEDCPGLAGNCPKCIDMFDRLRDAPRRPRPLSDPDATFTCPDCKMTTPNVHDVRNSYCPNCHAFKFETFNDVRCFEPTCPDFGSYDFGEGTCPAEHAQPPARRNTRAPRR